jgi:hypothetical protein
MKEQTLSPAERCPALGVYSKLLDVLDNRDTLEVLFPAGKPMVHPKSRKLKSPVLSVRLGTLGACTH